MKYGRGFRPNAAAPGGGTYMIDILQKTYQKIMRDKLYQLKFKIITNPLISRISETRALDAYTCARLAKKSTKVPDVISAFLRIVEEIKSLRVKDESIRADLVKEVKAKCFNNSSYYLGSFSELLELEIDVNQSPQMLIVQRYKSEYKEKTIRLSLEGGF